MKDSKGRFVPGVSSSPATQFKPGDHWRAKKDHWDKQWLQKKYVEEQISAGDMAVMCECTEANIFYWLKKHEIPRRDISEARKVKSWGLRGDKNGMYGRVGSENPNWKGGASVDRVMYYSSAEYKRLIKEVHEKNNFSCVRCGWSAGDNKNPLHTHHIVSFAVVELRYSIDNVTLLCKKCHNWVHSRENVKREYLSDK